MLEENHGLSGKLLPGELETFASRAASEKRLDEANDLVRKLAKSTDFREAAEHWTPLLRRHGRTDLELKWHKEAIARGIDAYAIVRATEAAWMSDGHEEGARIATVFAGRLDDMPFQHNGDLFHRRQILLMLNDYQRVFRYETQGAAPQDDRRPVHDGVAGGLYSAIWHAQKTGDKSLSHVRIRIYAALAPSRETAIRHLVDKIVIPNGDQTLAAELVEGTV